MLHLDTTARAKRVARDLKAALTAAGHPLPHSRCLELSSRMLGYPGYGMLARLAGHATRGLDDTETSPAEAAMRRAHQGRVLAEAGIPHGLIAIALDAARPTSRSKAGPAGNRRDAGDAPAFGYAHFDEPVDLNGPAPGGWRCLPSGLPVRFRSSSDLDPDVTWWSNLTFERRRRLGLHDGNVLFDRFLPVSPLSALRELGVPESGPGAVAATAILAGDVLGLSARLLGAPPRAHTLLVLGLAGQWSAGGGDRPLSPLILTPWEEFVPTSVRPHRGSPFETFRKPRVAYARSMMAERVPVGPFERVDLASMPSPADRRRWLERRDDLAFVRIRQGQPDAGRCPIRFSTWLAGGEAHWIAKPYFDVLSEGTGLAPAEALLCSGMEVAATRLPASASAFLAEAEETSWRDGIVAEAVWRSGLPAQGKAPGSWSEGPGAVYLRGIDLARMCREALRLAGEGAAVTSYGLGWVRHTRPLAGDRPREA